MHRYLGVEAPALDSFELDPMLRALDITMQHKPNRCLPLTEKMLYQIYQTCEGLGMVGLIIFGFFGFIVHLQLKSVSS